LIFLTKNWVFIIHPTWTIMLHVFFTMFNIWACLQMIPFPGLSISRTVSKVQRWDENPGTPRPIQFPPPVAGLIMWDILWQFMTSASFVGRSLCKTNGGYLIAPIYRGDDQRIYTNVIFNGLLCWDSFQSFFREPNIWDHPGSYNYELRLHPCGGNPPYLRALDFKVLRCCDQHEASWARCMAIDVLKCLN
jgi:hypothetical protein